MGLRMGDGLGKILYGSIFMVLFPCLMAFWAIGTSLKISVPIPISSFFSWLIFSLGLFCVVMGMLNLKTYGKGLPMNAYPPKYFVRKGLYYFHKHPIYFGTVLVSFGIAGIFGSSSGFWLVSPLILLMLVVYVLGFENEIIEKNFGNQEYFTLCSLPQNSKESLNWKLKSSNLIISFLSVLLFEFLVSKLLLKTTYVSIIEFIIQSELNFNALLVGLLLFFALIMSKFNFSKKEIRDLRIDTSILIFVTSFYYIFIERTVNFKIESIHNLVYANSNLSLLSIYITGCFGLFFIYVAKNFFHLKKRQLVIWIFFLACILFITGYPLTEVIVNTSVLLMLMFRDNIWILTKKSVESIGNSWSEKTFGPIRIINHGYYGGLAAFFGCLVISCFIPERGIYFIPIIVFCTVLGAALWAQIIEGSPKLLRPYGYYGSVLGAFFSTVLLFFVADVHPLQFLAALALCAPWVQIVGRLRCLVQGCCHGKKTNDFIGIRFNHPKSRVHKVSSLKGEFLHPTQLYSIGSNFLCGCILFKLVENGFDSTFIIGNYLIMNALSRFLEEYFRGEAQTPYWKGMRIYQWIAIFFLIAGIVISAIESNTVIYYPVTLNSIIVATSMGIFALFAYGIDFPKSNRRFARLTSD